MFNHALQHGISLSRKYTGTCRIWRVTTGVLDLRETEEGRLSFVGTDCCGCDTNWNVFGYAPEATELERERERTLAHTHSHSCTSYAEPKRREISDIERHIGPSQSIYV